MLNSNIEVLKDRISIVNEAVYKLKDASKYILEEDKSILDEYIKDIETQKKKLEWILEKLKEGYIEVAFAGLEKAGKSTFINAFIEMDILPSAHERTTFTITELRYSQESKVEVEFYTYNEFINEVFRKMLEEIKYSNPETISFEKFSEKDLDDHFKYLEENDKATYALHANRTETDLRDIIKGKEKIKSLLNNNKKVFSEDNIEDYKNYITDKYESRAVKRVTIYTPKLENIKNIIIYDLPGFDSPTIVHSKFTVDTLKKVDAVVFVRKLREPSIKGPELDIVNKVKEEDGIPIREKTFFFLNQADLVDKKEEVIDDKNKFINELKEKKLYESDDRILVGSAKAHLESISNQEQKPSYEKLKTFGIENEIKYLKKRLEEFNEKYRVPILERRINNITNVISQTIQKALNVLDKNKGGAFKSAIGASDIHYFSDKLKNSLTKKLENLQIESKTFLQGGQLSQKLKEKIIENINPPSEELINETKNKVSAETSTLEEKPDSFNIKLRDSLSKKIESKIRESTYLVLDEETNKIYKSIINIFKESIQDNLVYLKDIANSIDKNDLDSEELNSIIDKFVDKNNLFRTYEISSLVMRFLGDILELLIKSPLNSQDRKNKLQQAKGEVYTLWAFSPNFDPNLNINLVERSILYQEQLSESLDLLQKITNKIKDMAKKPEKFIEAISTINQSLTFIPLNFVISKLEKSENINQFINSILNSDQFNQPESKIPVSYDDVLEEVNKDLENLKELINSSVIIAVNPEKAFVNSTSIYVRNIINKLNTDEYLDFVKEISNFLSSKSTETQIEEMLKLLRINDAYTDIKNLLKYLQWGV